MAVIRYSKEQNLFRLNGAGYQFLQDYPFTQHERKHYKHNRIKHMRTNAKKALEIYMKNLRVK